MKLAARYSCSPRRGSALIAVLVILTLLALASYQFAELMDQELAAAFSAHRAAKAKACADSGVYYAAALLADPDSVSGRLNGNIFDNPGGFQQIAAGGVGLFDIVAPSVPGESSSAVRFGVVDETGKINLNALIQNRTTRNVAYEMLMKIPNMTEEAADSIIDWIDADEDPRPNGAENTTYGSMIPSYRCKNGPIDSIEELLLVRGVTPRLLFGTDYNRNGIEDPGENDGAGWDPGWASYFTIYSRERNVDSEGNPRLFLNDSSLASSHDSLKETLGEPLANFILLYRTQSDTAPSGGMPSVDAAAEEIADKVAEVLESSNMSPKSISSRYILLDATVYFTVMVDVNGQMQQKRVMVKSPLADAAARREMLPLLLDRTTTQRDAEIPARVNIMTASAEVLACLPGMTDAEVQAIIGARPSLSDSTSTDLVYRTPAWMVLDANITPDRMRALERYITARSQVYRVQSVGYLETGGPVARVEAVIDANEGRPRIVMYRDLSDLGRGFNPARN